jgi:hypothetical protein
MSVWSLDEHRYRYPLWRRVLPGLDAAFLLRNRFSPICSPALPTDELPLKSIADLKHLAQIHDM